MRKKFFMLSLLAATAVSGMAQKIDFNNGQNKTEDGFTGYVVSTATQADISVDAVSITASIYGTPSGQTLKGEWWKDGVNKYSKLVGDGMGVYGLDSNNNTPQIQSGEVGITLTISGLAAGEHSLLAYHNNPSGYQGPKLDVYVDGVKQLTGVEQTNRAMTPTTSGQSYIKFTAQEGKSVVVTYLTTPDASFDYTQGYNTTSLFVNGIVFDRPNPLTTAADPTPEHLDYHFASNDNGTATLSWTAAALAVKHKIFMGTSADNMELVGETTEPTYTTGKLSVHNAYYWRVDEVDNNGAQYEGDTWLFRPRRLAFPEAEGYGRFAQGGRGGAVYHVTNLNHDHNPGSLLYGLTDLEGPRTIVFDVSGLIVMDFNSVFCDPYVTIAAQTAPGKGICLKNSNLNIGSDCICRFLRAKRGYGDTGNAMGATGADNTIIDHTTAAWGTDETFSSRGAKNLTFQYSMISEALGIADHKNYPEGTNHGYAATIDGLTGTFSHNLLVNCNGRNWSMGGGMDGNNMPIGQMDIFNNVCYNWWKRTTDGGCHAVNFVNNYYKMGTDTQLSILFSQDYELPDHPGVWQAYISGNIRENKNHTLTQDALNETYRYTIKNSDVIDPNTRTDGLGYSTFVDTPFFPSYATIHSAKDAMKIVTSYSGAIMPQRDNHHVRNINETITGTYTHIGSRSGIKGEIDNESDAGGFEEYPEETRAANWDTDQDGMPDWYETLVGSDPNTANNNDDTDGDGWTMLEDYLEFMAHPYIFVEPNGSGTFDMKPHFIGFFGQNSRADMVTPTFTVDNGSDLITTAEDGSNININAKGTNGIAVLTVTVNDGETTFSQRMSVVVSSEADAIEQLDADDNAEVVKHEFFTLDGKPAGALLPTEVYLVKKTMQNGKVKTAKVIAQ